MPLSTTLTLTLRSDIGAYRDMNFRLTSEQLDTNWTNIKTAVEDMAGFCNDLETDITTLQGDVTTLQSDVTEKSVIKTVVSLVYADSPYDADWDTFIKCDCTGGAITVNIPTAVGNSGREITLIKTDVSVDSAKADANAPETINGVAYLEATSQYAVINIISDGANLFKK